MAKCSRCGQQVMVAPVFCGRCNGSGLFKDRHDNTISTGDQLRSAYNGMVFTFKFGWHQQWCDLDQCWLPGYGYYCEAEDGGQFPIGQLAEWAEKVQ